MLEKLIVYSRRRVVMRKGFSISWHFVTALLLTRLAAGVNYPGYVFSGQICKPETASVTDLRIS